jgi:hypothetical protein
MFFASKQAQENLCIIMLNTSLKHGEVGEEHNIHLTRAVSHCNLAICIKKYLKAKEE